MWVPKKSRVPILTSLPYEGGTSLSAAKGVVCVLATPFVPQSVPPGPLNLFSHRAATRRPRLCNMPRETGGSGTGDCYSSRPGGKPFHCSARCMEALPRPAK